MPWEPSTPHDTPSFHPYTKDVHHAGCHRAHPHRRLRQRDHRSGRRRDRQGGPVLSAIGKIIKADVALHVVKIVAAGLGLAIAAKGLRAVLGKATKDSGAGRS